MVCMSTAAWHQRKRQWKINWKILLQQMMSCKCFLGNSVLVHQNLQFCHRFYHTNLNINLNLRSELYDPECVSLNYMELLEKSKQLSFEVTPSQQAAVEKASQEQLCSRIWFRFRTGRITASKMHAVLHTNCVLPSLKVRGFTVQATSWGVSTKNKLSKPTKQF